MVALARERLGRRARVEVADLEQPLGVVPSGEIDVVVASLVLHYIADCSSVRQSVTARMWRRPLSVVFGQLRQAGFVIDVVDEPLPQPGQDATPEMFELSSKPVFLFVRAVRPSGRPTNDSSDAATA